MIKATLFFTVMNLILEAINYYYYYYYYYYYADNAFSFFTLVASLNSVPSGLELLRLAEKNWEQGEDWRLFQ